MKAVLVVRHSKASRTKLNFTKIPIYHIIPYKKVMSR
nr:MAG TPA: hypothetical protein [Caudoviricetes sp.]